MKPNGPAPAWFSADAEGRLTIGAQDCESLVEEAGGTPLFAYDNELVGRQIATFRAVMPDGIALHYAVKANPYGPLLRFIGRYVDGFDIASLGELQRLRDEDLEALPISFAGPAKRDKELEAAITAGLTVNLESEGEAGRALRVAERIGIRPRLAVRVNPPFALKGAGMKMGGLASPFGVDSARAAALIAEIVAAGADWRGLHIYAGSQMLDAAAIVAAQRATVALAAEIGDVVSTAPAEVNLGGGFGIPYFAGEQPLALETVGPELAQILRNVPDILANSRFAIELGRWLVGEAGVYLTRIIDRKQSGGRTFLVTDGGLHHMLAASGNFGQLLRRNFPVAIAGAFGAPAAETVTVTGCSCTPLDLLADEIELPAADVGDLVAIFCAGAYGLTASPQAFLSHPPAREMLV